MVSCVFFPFSFFFFLKTGGSESSPLVFAFCVYIRKTGVLLRFFFFSQRAVGKRARPRKKKKKSTFFFERETCGDVRARRPRSLPSRRHRKETRGKTPPDQVVIEREDILPSSVSAGTKRRGKNDDDDDDDQKKAGNSKGIAKRNGQKTDPEDAKEMDSEGILSIVGERESKRRWMSPVALILLLLDLTGR